LADAVFVFYFGKETTVPQISRRVHHFQ
jgi:hypothetical protein